MKGYNKPIFLVLFLAMVSVGCADHLQEGIDAYKKRNYSMAFAVLKPLADDGDAEAQAFVGRMYDNGEGVPMDYRLAVEWYRKSAEQGSAFGQYNLGVMYAGGLGVQRDAVQALKWLDLATVRGNGQKVVIDAAKQAEASMTPEQIREAERLADGWLAQHK